jgi:hypothetical protein
VGAHQVAPVVQPVLRLGRRVMEALRGNVEIGRGVPYREVGRGNFGMLQEGHKIIDLGRRKLLFRHEGLEILALPNVLLREQVQALVLIADEERESVLGDDQAANPLAAQRGDFDGPVPTSCIFAGMSDLPRQIFHGTSFADARKIRREAFPGPFDGVAGGASPHSSKGPKEEIASVRSVASDTAVFAAREGEQPVGDLARLLACQREGRHGGAGNAVVDVARDLDGGRAVLQRAGSEVGTAGAFGVGAMARGAVGDEQALSFGSLRRGGSLGQGGEGK